MKSVLIAAAAALVLPLPAMAQSLSDTHEAVWLPAGKTPPVTYRERGRATCATAGGHHQAGKGAMPARKKCVATETAKVPTATVADAATAR